MGRLLPVVLVVLGLGGSTPAQTLTLAEPAAAGASFRVELSLTVSGKLKVQLPGDKQGTESLEAVAAHAYVERGESGGPAIRLYSRAASTGVVSGTKQVRELAAGRRTILVRPSSSGPQHVCPAGPLGRDELELVSEHFDTLALPRLLPGKAVAATASWPIPDEAVKTVCLFEELKTNTLVGTLVAVREGEAEFTVEGSAEGVERGAAVKIGVKARGRFDRTANRIVALTWDQQDDRGAGPVSPAAELRATVTVRRTFLAEEPKDLAAARAAVPDKTAEADLLLRHTDPAGKYSFLYPRAWHVTAQTDDHLVLRLIERGDWVAQATILSLKPAAGGGHMTAAEFKGAIAKQPGWEPAAVAADGELPAAAGRWLYRHTAAGKQDGLAVVQSFYCLAEAGRQVVVTVVARDDRAAKLAGRDVSLVNAIEFPEKK